VELEFFTEEETPQGRDGQGGGGDLALGDTALTPSEEPLTWSIGLDIASPSSDSQGGGGVDRGAGTNEGTAGGCHYVDPDTVMIEFAV
jgi:hypothetical protein